MTFSEQILNFYSTLHIAQKLPKGVEVLHPYKDEMAMALCKTFYNQYYGDQKKRFIIMGINPGRLGGGLTGIPFTDPVKLEKYCHIPNDLPKKAELSADFIYAMIEAFGGAKTFYKKFYISAVSPLGFMKDGKNLNYYDIPKLQEVLKPFIVTSLQTQLPFGIHTTTCFCLGEGQNYKYLKRLNDELQIFDTVVPLPHPRFIMQYKRKKVAEYVDLYLEKLSV
ncbi:uracil-DNA glycosylase family protein [Chryseolinea lacunae]|uniref:DUF4918 family protein n=1 Tax=Chryseolinea lacunae TaxID=2801331 RepID=A0ABS1KLS2_9BACT|nr:uracil-DNA glycosylase family protein [Chryseolinea lacunae]MBL0740187.1 DUF4918 family protein [Chryseolinea lacunae]